MSVCPVMLPPARIIWQQVLKFSIGGGDMAKMLCAVEHGGFSHAGLPHGDLEKESPFFLLFFSAKHDGGFW